MFLLFSAVHTGSFGITASAETTSGTTGDCTWTLDGTRLTVCGNCKMLDCNYDSTMPRVTDVTAVIVEQGVKSIGDNAFARCTNITVPDSVTNIEEYAFAGCDNLIIKTSENSAAHKYAEEYNIDFELIRFAVKLGDADGDGEITVKDTIAILRYDAEAELLTGTQIIAGDLNGNKAVNTKDAILILQYDAQIIEKFPIE